MFEFILFEVRTYKNVLKCSTFTFNIYLSQFDYFSKLGEQEKAEGFLMDVLKNYRPVSNLAFVGKVIEKVVAQQLTHHLTANNLHEKFQSAYKALHSTETALLKVQSDILESVDAGNVVVLVMLDLSAAFDTIDHNMLFDRLVSRFGVTDAALLWFQSYLKDRQQSVNIDGVQSDPKPLAYGVPQGSVLGPLLFTCYTAPLCDIIIQHGLNQHFYADDGQLYMVIKLKRILEPQQTLQQIETCVKDVCLWMLQNMLKLNDDKTEVIVFGTKHNLRKVEGLTVQVGSASVKHSRCVRNLGVMQDELLNMKKQVANICRTSNYQLRNIGFIRRYLTADATKLLVHAFIVSRLDYGNALLYGMAGGLVKKLQTVQNSAARLITRTSKRDHITPALFSLHWLPVAYRIQFKILVYVYRALNDLAPSYLADMIQLYSPSRTLRSQNKLLLAANCRTKLKTIGDRSFQVAGPKLWNELPIDIRSSKDLVTFKRNLKTYFFNKHYIK